MSQSLSLAGTGLLTYRVVTKKLNQRDIFNGSAVLIIPHFSFNWGTPAGARSHYADVILYVQRNLSTLLSCIWFPT